MLTRIAVKMSWIYVFGSATEGIVSEIWQRVFSPPPLSKAGVGSAERPASVR